MSKMYISKPQAEALLAARKLSSSARKAEKSRIFRAIKADHGIPASTKIVLCIENPANGLYRVIRDKASRVPLDNGIQEQVKAPVKAKSVASKSAAKKATPVKAPAKAATKKASVKAPTKKASVKTAAKKATPQTGYPKAVRISHNGFRVRLGTAKDAAHEKRMIAAYKKAN